MLATGVLIFLLFDVLSKASDPITAALDQVRTQQTGTGTFALDMFLLVWVSDLARSDWCISTATRSREYG